MIKSIVVLTLSLISLHCSHFLAQAESVHITALIAAQPSDFRIQLSSTATPNLQPGQIITYTATYSSLLSQPTDMVVIKINWTEQLDQSANLAAFQYVSNSATPALNNSQPTIDLLQKTITWVISPMPALSSHKVSWQLQVNPQITTKLTGLATTSALLTGPGVQIVSPNLEQPFIITPGSSINPQPSQATTTPDSSPQPSSQPTAHPTIPVIQPTIIPTSPTPGASALQVGLIGLLTLIPLFGILYSFARLIRNQAPYRLWLWYRQKTLLRIYPWQPHQQVALWNTQLNHCILVGRRTGPPDVRQSIDFSLESGTYAIQRITPAQPYLLIRIEPTYRGRILHLHLTGPANPPHSQ